jgi:hypothetical protein
MSILAFLAGFLLSVAAAYYSIVGLIALFPGAVVAVVAMGSSLELAKLVAVSWLYRNWNVAPTLLKTYLSIAILVLMFITSMGVFGFLSKAHLEHSLTANADVTFEIETIDQRIAAQKKTVSSFDTQIDALDKTYARYVELGSLTKGLEQKRLIDDQREKLSDGRDAAQSKLLSLQETRNKLNITVKKQEAEVGPLKYIAELIYKDQSKDSFDKAVRMVILLLIVVFDPLAVMLLIAGNVSMINKLPKPTAPKPRLKTSESIEPRTKRKYTRRIPKETYVVKDDFGIKPVGEEWQPHVLRTKK